MWPIEWPTTRWGCLALASLGVGVTAQAQTGSALPARAPLQVAVRDPFSPFAPPAPPPRVVRPAPAPVAQTPVAAPLQAPVLPAVDLVFMGRLQTRTGVQVLAQHLGQPVLLVPGAALTNGYVVQTITAKEVALRHEAQNHVAHWALPTPPAFETR